MLTYSLGNSNFPDLGRLGLCYAVQVAMVEEFALLNVASVKVHQ